VVESAHRSKSQLFLDPIQSVDDLLPCGDDFSSAAVTLSLSCSAIASWTWRFATNVLAALKGMAESAISGLRGEPEDRIWMKARQVEGFKALRYRTIV